MAKIKHILPRETNLQATSNTVVIAKDQFFSFTVAIQGTDKKDIKRLKKYIKWVWLDAKHLKTLKTLNKAEKFGDWGDWANKEKSPINFYGIGIDYAKSTSVRVGRGEIGKKYWLEAFVEYPEFQHPIGKYFMIKGEPQILNAIFDEIPKADDKSKIKKLYGQTVTLKMETHALPDATLGYHNFAVFEVHMHDQETDKVVTDTPFRGFVNFGEVQDRLNNTVKMGIIIEDSWKNKTNHNKEKELKNYYAKITVTHYTNKDAIYKGKAKSVGPFGNSPDSQFTTQSPNGELIAVIIKKEDWEKEHWLEHVLGRSETNLKAHAAKYQKKSYSFSTLQTTTCDVPLSVEVPFTTQEMAIEVRKVAAGLMMAEVKDQEYTCKNYDVCKFTAIEVTAGTQSCVTIFNENETNDTVTDNTTKTFSFVTGDSKKEKVTITLKELTISDHNPGDEYKCYQDEAHSTENLVNKEKMLKQWLIKDGEPNPEKHSTYKVNGNTIELQMGYEFNKSYDNSVLNYLAHEQNAVKNGLLGDAIKNLWVIRYLLKMIKNEDLVQPYVIPINTCRYPSQMIKLNVYPDLKWVINFNYNVETPLYYKQTQENATYLARFHEGTDDFGRPLLVSSNSRERQKVLDKEISNALVGFAGQKTSFNIGIECQVGDSTPFDLNKLYEKKFQSMLAPLMWIHDFIDGTFGVSDAKAIDKKVKAQKVGKFNKLAKRLNKHAMSFELTPPKIAFGVGIGYGNASNNNVGYELEGQLLMNPIIGANVKLDVLALGSKFKPWGLIITALDLVSFATNLFSGGRVELDYKIDIIFTAEILLVSSKSKNGEANPATLGYNFLDKKISGDIGLQGRLKGEIIFAFGIKLKGKIKKIEAYKKAESNSKIKEMGVGVSVNASSEVVMTLGTSFGKGNNFDTDFYFSGVNIVGKIYINSKSLDVDKNIIPDFEKKFDVLKNKGEYK